MASLKRRTRRRKNLSTIPLYVVVAVLFHSAPFRPSSSVSSFEIVHVKVQTPFLTTKTRQSMTNVWGIPLSFSLSSPLTQLSMVGTDPRTSPTDAPPNDPNPQSNQSHQRRPYGASTSHTHDHPKPYRKRQTRNIDNTRRQQQRPRNFNRKSKWNAKSPTGKKHMLIRDMFQKAKYLERKGQWNQAVQVLRTILREWDPYDAYSHLALAKLEARRHAHLPNSTVPVLAFEQGTKACPESIHLWQAWATYEDSIGHTDRARALFEQALKLDEYNPYVLHGYGLLEKRIGNFERARELWHHALKKTSTAALVCSLGELLTARKHYNKARDLYAFHAPRVKSSRQRTEIYLSSAWLQERYFQDIDEAKRMLHKALDMDPRSTKAQVALARLEGRGAGGQSPEDIKRATMRRLATACEDESHVESGGPRSNSQDLRNSGSRNSSREQPQDGRVYNEWAKMEVQSGRSTEARRILLTGIERHPKDHTLLQAAGRIEERFGNFSGARDLYRASLYVQPSAPTLVSYALLELRHPESKTTGTNFTRVRQLMEEALMLDPRHGPAYNSYGNAELQRGDVGRARKVFERGVQAKCSDVASVYHGYAKLELAQGNVERAREILKQGLEKAHLQEVGMDSPHRDRTSFLSHTLGMLELNSQRPVDALAVFTDGIERYGNNSQLLLGAALSEVKLGNENGARQLFERSALADNKHAQAWQAWGCMEMRAGNWTTAKTLLECGIKSAPRHGALWLAYATLLGRMGQIDESRTIFAKGIRRAPKHAPLYQAWASLELRQDNIANAKKLITEALTRDKQSGSGWLVAAEIEGRLGNIPLQGLILRRGIECCPTHAALYRALGDAMLRQNKIDDAREIYEQGIETDPLHAPLYHALAELEARVCNVAGLSKLNKRAAEVFRTSAVEAIPSTMASGQEAWSKRIRAAGQSGRSGSVPRGVAALAERIVDDDDGPVDATAEKPSAQHQNTDATLLLESLSIDDEGELIDGLLTERQEEKSL